MAAAAPALAPVSPNTTTTTSPVARRFTVLAHENQAEFDRMLSAFQFQYRPRTEHEKFLVNQLAISSWRLERGRRFEARALDQLAGAPVDPADPDARIVARMFESNPKALAAIQNSAAQAERSYYRAWRQIIETGIDVMQAVAQDPVVRAANRIISNYERSSTQNEPNPPANSKTKPSLRSQYPDNLALCL